MFDVAVVGHADRTFGAGGAEAEVFFADGVEDEVQEAFARASVQWSRVGGMDRPATWVYVVAARRLRRRLRRRRVREGERTSGSQDIVTA